LAVACKDVDVRTLRAIIIGPHETPYEFGFFEVCSLVFSSPTVLALTTNCGRCRFNPNIYSNGKVCFTWRGESGEQWSAAQGMESILLSIQSLMSTNPYENEPGYEEAHAETDKQNQAAYVKKIRHETLRITVIQRLEEYLGLRSNGTIISKPESKDVDGQTLSAPFVPFKDLCKQRFLWYYSSYLAAVRDGMKDISVDEPFIRMPFEGSSNIMEGKFNYPALEKRLHNIKAALDKELELWAHQGLEAVKGETSVAANLSHKFQQVTHSLKADDLPHDLRLDNGNPFVWILTYFGKPMSNFDGGFFRIRINFSVSFPDEQPRVRLETPIFHIRVAPDGTLCYFPNPMKKEDLQSHIHSIIEALEEENPAYDPRTLVNPEAFKLYWGPPADRKVYNRRLRRSVQDIME
ncbi:hypothetical protein TD95_000871, partial [Thielaviopsis punctulata]